MPAHGDRTLSALFIDDYSADLRDEHGLVGDRASMRAFADLLRRERERARRRDGADPLEDASEQPSKQDLDRAVQTQSKAGDVVQQAVERFSHALADVISTLLAQPAWRGTERIAIGGGMSGSKIGELAIARTQALLDLTPEHLVLTSICHDPDAAGLLGAVHLPASNALRQADCLLAVDIGGSKMRIGCVAFDGDLDSAGLTFSDIWEHKDDQPSRDDAVDGIVGMLCRGIDRAVAEGRRLSPYIGIGCPGLIRADGAIERGGQNLPGNWDAPFNLPETLAGALPSIAGQRPLPLMHNDAVVQGLSEASRMRDVAHWGVLTIGTGLGNARFTNR